MAPLPLTGSPCPRSSSRACRELVPGGRELMAAGCCLSQAEHGTCPRAGVGLQSGSSAGLLNAGGKIGSWSPGSAGCAKPSCSPGLFTDVLLLCVLLARERSLLALIFMFPHSPVSPDGLHKSQQGSRFFTKSIFLLRCRAEGNGQQPTRNCSSWLQIATLSLSDEGQRREKLFAHHQGALSIRF